MASITDLALATTRWERPNEWLSFVDAFFRAKRAIFACCLSFSLAFAVYLASRSPVFRSEALVLVKAERIETPAAEAAPAGADVSDAQLGTEVQLLASKELHAAILREARHSSAESPVPEEELKKFESRFQVSLVPKSSLIRIGYSDSTPGGAHDFLQSAVRKYFDYHVAVHRSDGSFEFFNAQAVRCRRNLQDAQQKLDSFERRNRISLLPEQKDLALHRISELKAELNEAETARLEDVRRQLAIADSVGSAEPRIKTQKREVPNQYLIEHLGTELVDLQNKRTALLTKFNSGDRLVKEVERQISDTTAALNQASRDKETEQSTDVNPLRQSLEADLSKSHIQVSGEEARTAALSAEVARLEQQLTALGDETAEEEQLQLDTKEAAENYKLYSRKSEEARISGALDREKISNVTLAEAPTVSSRPDSRLSLSSVFGLMLGNASILGFGLMAAMRRPTIREPWELEAMSDRPVLAAIPLDPQVRKAVLQEVE